MPVIFEGERIFMHTVGIGKQNYESLIMSDCFYDVLSGITYMTFIMS